MNGCFTCAADSDFAFPTFHRRVRVCYPRYRCHIGDTQSVRMILANPTELTEKDPIYLVSSIYVQVSACACAYF